MTPAPPTPPEDDLLDLEDLVGDTAKAGRKGLEPGDVDMSFEQELEELFSEDVASETNEDQEGILDLNTALLEEGDDGAMILDDPAPGTASDATPYLAQEEAPAEVDRGEDELALLLDEVVESGADDEDTLVLDDLAAGNGDDFPEQDLDMAGTDEDDALLLNEIASLGQTDGPLEAGDDTAPGPDRDSDDGTMLMEDLLDDAGTPQETAAPQVDAEDVLAPQQDDEVQHDEAPAAGGDDLDAMLARMVSEGLDKEPEPEQDISEAADDSPGLDQDAACSIEGDIPDLTAGEEGDDLDLDMNEDDSLLSDAVEEAADADLDDLVDKVEFDASDVGLDAEALDTEVVEAEPDAEPVDAEVQSPDLDAGTGLDLDADLDLGADIDLGEASAMDLSADLSAEPDIEPDIEPAGQDEGQEPAPPADSLSASEAATYEARIAQLEERIADLEATLTKRVEELVPLEAARIIRDEIAALAQQLSDE